MKFETIRKSSAEEDRKRLIAGMRWLTAKYPKKYHMSYDKDGDVWLYETGASYFSIPLQAVS